MNDLTQSDFAFTGFLAATQARYQTDAGRAALTAEIHTPSAIEIEWQRMVEHRNRATQRQRALDIDQIVHERMLAAIDDDYAHMARFRAATTTEGAAT